MAGRLGDILVASAAITEEQLREALAAKNAFGMLGETIELRVAASNRDCYAQGALAAAKFLVRQSAGMYNMFDVLGMHQSTGRIWRREGEPWQNVTKDIFAKSVGPPW